MGKAFGDSEGQAKKNKLDYIKFEEGVNKMRMIGDLVPRYAYWKPLNGKNIPVECLAFNREKEEFDNLEKDWFKHYFPTTPDGKETRCVWSYAIRVIDLKSGKVKMCGLKKKLFEQIQSLAKKLEKDPTDPVEGFDIVFEKVKTGSHAFNVEYRLDQLESTPRELTDEEKALVEEELEIPIDKYIPRLTPDQQKQFIDANWVNPTESNVDDDAADAVDDDKPF